MAFATGTAVCATPLGAQRRRAPERPLGLRAGARISWVCVRCSGRLTAALGTAPACGCGGPVRPTKTS